jgi:hypothetical protein
VAGSLKLNFNDNIDYRIQLEYNPCSDCCGLRSDVQSDSVLLSGPSYNAFWEFGGQYVTGKNMGLIS